MGGVETTVPAGRTPAGRTPAATPAWTPPARFQDPDLLERALQPRPSPDAAANAARMTHTRSHTQIGTPPEFMRVRPAPRPGSVTEATEKLLGIDPFYSARGTLLPIARNVEGEGVFAWPETAINAVEGLLMPGHLLKGGSATPDEMRRTALELSGIVAGGGIPAGRVAAPRPSLAMGGTRRPLPMDEASRMRRAQDQGYDLDAPAFRGDAMPNEYPKGALFTYDPDYAGGFTHRGGVREFVFRDRNPLGAGHPVTLGQLRDIAKAIQSREGDKAAEQFVHVNSSIPDDLQTFFKRSANADRTIPVSRDGSLTLRYLQQQTRDHKAIAREAGLTELHDAGFFDRIEGTGIRDKTKAAFDRRKIGSRNVLAIGGIPAGPLLVREE